MKPRSSLALRVIALTLTSAVPSHAATATKSATGTDLTLAGSWSGGSGPGFPTSADIATWDSTSLGAGLTVASDVFWGSINISGALSDIGITGTGIITTSNITLTGSKTLTIANKIALSGNSIYNIADVTSSSASDTTLSGEISGSFGLTKSGTGTLVLSGANTYTGTTIVSHHGGWSRTVPTLLLNSSSGPAIAGNLQIGNSGTGYVVVHLGASDQIADTSTITFTGTTNNWSYFKLLGHNETVAGLSSTANGVIENMESEVVNTNVTLTVNNSSDYSYAGYIRNRSDSTGTGTLAITKEGSGKQTLEGSTFTYTGLTTINNGILALNGTGGFASDITLGSSNTPTLQLDGTWTMSKAISGGNNATVEKIGSGTVTLTGSNTYTGATTINNGILVLNNTTGFASDITLGTSNSPKLQLDGTWTLSKAISGGNNATVEKIGSGTVTLSGANTYTGATTINNGILVLNNTTGFASDITLGTSNSPKLQLDGTWTMSKAISGGTNATVEKIGSGTVTLSGTNTYTAGTTVSNGTLALGFGTITTNILSTSSALILSGGTLQLTGTGTQTLNGVTTTASTGSRILLGSNETLTLGALASAGANSSLNFNTATGGSNGATVGTGIVVLNGQTAGNAINTGFTVSDAGGFGLATVNASDQVVRLTTTTLLPAAGAVATTDYRVDNNAGGTAASGSSNLTLTASEAAQSITVDTTTSSGVLTLDSGVILSNNTWNFGGGSNAYQITGNTSGAGLQSVISGDTINLNNYNAGTVTIAANILANGANNLNLKGTGTTVFSGSNTYTGLTTINNGVLALSDGDNRLATTGTLRFGGSGTLSLVSNSQTLNTVTVDNAVTGTITGTGTLTLTGDFNHSPTASSNSINMSGLSKFVFTASTFSVAPTTVDDITATLKLAKNSTITADTVYIGKDSVGSSAKPNTGRLELGQTTVINAGSIYVGLNRSSGTLTFQSGLLANPTLSIRGKSGGDSRANLDVSNINSGGTTYTRYGTVDVTGGKLDARLEEMNIGYNTRANTTTKNTGEFKMGVGTLDALSIYVARDVSGSGTAQPVNGTLGVNGGTIKVDTLTLGTQYFNTLYATVTLDGAGTLAAKNITPGVGSATRDFNWKSGTIKNYDNASDLTINSGLSKFELSGVGLHEFDISTAHSGTVSQAISGSGALSKSGGGTLTLSGNNSSFSGGTSVNGGILVVNSDAGSGTVTVNIAGSKLAGTGSIGGATTLNTGTIHAVGAVGGVGKQSFAGNLSYSSGSIFEWGMAATPNESGRGVSYDAVNVAGTLGGGNNAIFRVVLDGAQDFSEVFWNSNRQWQDIFKTGDSGTAVSFEGVFGSIEYANSSSSLTPSSQGYFTISGSTLTWTAVPEASSVLAGLLLGAGLLRRRRVECQASGSESAKLLR